ncbi:MAG: N-formylglutamate deformylase [Gammaproteobacteria bacterium]|nr:N-formylglutamate deformylase [Gammaproteobacteria bacterium]
MTDVYSFSVGTTPLLVSVPHDGREIPADISVRMTPAALQMPDTDWHVNELYEFVGDIGAWVISANYSRYVIDLNRAATDESLYEGQVATGLCPHKTFAGDNIYCDSAVVDAAEKKRRTARFWKSYHERIGATIVELRERYGYALLWDAHSIPSRVPRLFDGELPVLNIGTFDDRSCSPAVSADVVSIANASSYETAINERFKGGHITRHYGDPQNNVHAVQLEIAQRAYMDESSGTFDNSKAATLRATLRAMLESFLYAASNHRK